MAVIVGFAIKLDLQDKLNLANLCKFSLAKTY